MDIQQILKVLKNERECIKRRCDLNLKRNCMECDLCLPDDETLEVLDFLIKGYELAETEGVNKYGREIFNGICPYTNKKCDTWTCNTCEVEARERKFMEGDTE